MMIRINKIKFLVGISFFQFIILNNSLMCQDEFKSNATAGFTFLQIPTTARVAALGEASIALSDMNAEGLFVNPAIVGFTDYTHSFSASYANWFADIKNYGTGYTYNSPLGVFGIGLILLDYGSMPRTTRSSGQKVYSVIGSFEANSIAAGLTYSKMMTDRFSVGVTLKYVQEKIDIYKADNILFDGGVLYYTGFHSLRIAATIHNFGTNSKFINDEFKMPATFKLGLAAEVFGDNQSEYKGTVIFEASHPNNSDERLNLGAEVSWRNIFIIRGGYKFFYDEENLSFGLGINPQLELPMSFDFAYSDYGRLGNILRFTLQLGMQ
jgi:hypothetical protein